MRPLADLAPEVLRRIRGVFVDIDDTLTTAGRLTAQAYCALEQIRDAGLLMVPVTGRPAGWCDHIARMWPVDAVIGENGALWYRYIAHERRMERRYAVEPEALAAQRERLNAIGARIVNTVRGTAIAADQPFRIADLAIDFREDVLPLPRESVDRILAMMQHEGLNAKVSSIHVNGWFGSYDKLATTRRMMLESFGVDLELCAREYIFVGDSPNDQPMFDFFPFSVGVANIRECSDRLTHPPAFITSQPAGAGFAQVAQCLLASAET